jgi:hypothetical protein
MNPKPGPTVKESGGEVMKGTLAVVFLLASLAARPSAQSLSGFAPEEGFDLSFSLVPKEEILPGGPPKDGIPALTNPRVIRAAQARYLHGEDLVVGVFMGGQARAYPLRILSWHEVANDTLAGRPIAVTYCPLCNSAFVFDRRIGGQVREFGVSGLLYNPNLLLYDRQARSEQESLWSQVGMRAITGPAARQGLRMTFLPSELTTWAEWVKKHPETTVLSDKTGYWRDYGSSPYRSYFASRRLWFPVRKGPGSGRFHPKKPMVLVEVQGERKAYSIKDVARKAGSQGFVEDEVGQRRLRLTYLKKGQTVRVEALDGGQVSVAYLFWFALNSMLPEVEVYRP